MWVHVDRYAVRSCEGVIERIFRGCSWGTARVKRERIARVYVLPCVTLRMCASAPWTVFFREVSACVGPRGCGGFRARTVRLIDSRKRPAITKPRLKSV